MIAISVLLFIYFFRFEGSVVALNFRQLNSFRAIHQSQWRFVKKLVYCLSHDSHFAIDREFSTAFDQVSIRSAGLLNQRTSKPGLDYIDTIPW